MSSEQNKWQTQLSGNAVNNNQEIEGLSPKYKKIIFAPTLILLFTSAFVMTWHFITLTKTGWVGMEIREKNNTIRQVFQGSPADKAGIQVGDTVLTINDISINDSTTIEEFTMSKMVGDTLIVRVKRGENKLTFPLFLETPLHTTLILVDFITRIIDALIFLAIGLFVYWKKSQNRHAFLFFILCVFFTVAAFLDTLPRSDEINTLELINYHIPTLINFIYVISILPFFMFLSLLLHFSLVFPKERPVVKNHPNIFKWIYGLNLAALFPIFNFIINPNRTIGIDISGLGSLKGDFVKRIGYLPNQLQLAIVISTIVSIIILTIYLFFKCWKSISSKGWKKGLISKPFSIVLIVIVIPSLVHFFGFLYSNSFFKDFFIRFTHSTIYSIITIYLAVIIFILFFILFLLYPLLICSILVRSYRKSEVEEKRQVRWPLWGIFIFAAIILITIIADILDEFLPQGILNFFTIPPSLKIIFDILDEFFILVIPISFAIGILKYRLMNIDFIIKKTIVYSIVSIILLTFYFVLIVVLGSFLIDYTGIKSQSVTIISTLAIAAVFIPVRKRVQNAVDRRFYRKKYDYPQALKTITNEIQQTEKLQALLKYIAEQTMQILPNRAVAIFLKGKDEQLFWAKEKVGLPDEIVGQLKLESTSNLFPKVDTIYKPNKDDLPEADWQLLEKVRSALTIPVKLKDELIGFISLGKKLSDQEYDEDDKDFLSQVAAQLAQGISNIERVEQEKEFEKAREIQQRLLPTEIHQLEGFEIAAIWQPARAVSGDYYDVLKLSDTKLGICIGDVVGKGMPAALLMSNLQAAVKAFASDDVPPKDLCEKVNNFLKNNIAKDQFITFFYGLLNAENKKFTYCRAGHNAPILVRKDASQQELEQGGLALGILRNAKYQQEELSLKPGDKILIFTDGVTEAMNPQNEEFGEERLNKLLLENRELDAKALQECIVKAVADFTGGAFQDDVTMIVVSVGNK